MNTQIQQDFTPPLRKSSKPMATMKAKVLSVEVKDMSLQDKDDWGDSAFKFMPYLETPDQFRKRGLM